ncbi:MAG: hypothetical protein K0S23_2860 [Fluviicola sp.]|jgi:hypothetical protein|uniref:hypothetical protein n=1 Tax=Fluviicola sp. TaxID=1917219 RepID=UPI0026309FC5|nr:hypothetical protein [Fluviicola sp.]MDF3028553.1 hypothetical protein [Fluviicola sp.]
MRLLISLVFIHLSAVFLAQTNNWVENSAYFEDKNPYGIGAYIFEDGSFQLTEGNYRFKFDQQGIMNRELVQEIVEEEVPENQKSSGCTAYDMKNNIRYTLADNIIHIEYLFSGKKNEYKAIPLEKQEHVVKSVWDQYSNNSNHVDAGIITSIEGKIILYQTYYAISANTHPDLFKPKGINTYLRLSILDLKDYSLSYEYLLLDVFNSAFGKKKEVLDLFDFKCIGMNANRELLFSVSKTSFKDRDSPPFTLSDYKGVDYCKSGIDVWSVNLADFSQKKVYSTVIESTPKASSVSLSFENNGWLLTWTEPREDYFTLHARCFKLDADYDIEETVVHFPSKELKLTKSQTPNIRNYKGMNGEELFCLSLPNYPSIFIMDKHSNLLVRDNSVLKWDLNKDYILSGSEMICLPCLKELPAQVNASLSGLPESIMQSAPHTRILKFRKVGNSIFYLHMESLNKGTETGYLKIRQLFLKTGNFQL